MLKTFEYRLYPNRVQRGMLLSCLADSRLLYNEMLEMVKSHYDETGKFLSRYDLNMAFKGRGGENVPQTTVQTLADRLDASWSAFKNILVLKAENAGVRVIEVSPHFTSQRCSGEACGEIVGKSLSVRTHVCPHCGYVEDRDTNAAKNILCKARAEPLYLNVGASLHGARS